MKMPSAKPLNQRQWRRARERSQPWALPPLFPSTGYGYIEQGGTRWYLRQSHAYKVARFTEKPDAATAQTFIDSGRFSWNSGMFIFPAHVMLTEFKTHAPELIKPIMEKGCRCLPRFRKAQH
jgi:mannose-1-phosphate guanylyltransferase